MNLRSAALIPLLIVPSFASAEVWLADIDVSMTAVKDTVAHTLTYTVTITNNGDDTARETLIYFIPPLGLSVTPVRGFAQVPGIPATSTTLRARIPLLDPRVIRQVTFVVANPTDGPAIATVQAMGAVPDFDGGNNSETIETL